LLKKHNTTETGV